MAGPVSKGKKEDGAVLAGAEKKRLVNKMTKQVMEEMTGKDSFLRYREAEVAQELEGKDRAEQNRILDEFADELFEEYPFVGEWRIALKPTTYIDEEGNEVKGQTVIERKTLEKKVREHISSSVNHLLEQVAQMGEAAAGGETVKAKVELGLEEEGAGEFNGSIAKALVENLPDKLEGSVKVAAIKDKEDEYTGDVALTWVGKVGKREEQISLFTGKPVGSTKKA